MEKCCAEFFKPGRKTYFKNLSNTISQNSNNNLSLKVIYFLDYLKLKNSLHKKP